MKKKLQEIVNRSSVKIYALLFIFCLLLVSIWFGDGHMMATAESGFPFYNLSFMSNISSHTWTSLNLGNGMGIRVASYPTYTFLSYFEKLNIPGYLIQAGFFFFILYSAALGIYHLTKHLFPELKEKYLLLGVLFYWFNPFSLVSVWNRFLNNYMVFWALIPIVTFFFLKGITEKKYSFAVIASLSTFIFSYALTSPVFSILLWFLLSYITIYFIITKKDFLFYVKFFAITLLTFILFNLWWIVNFLISTFSIGYQVVISQFLSTQGNLSTLHALSQASGKFINTIRLMEIDFFNSDGPPWARMYISLPSVLLEFDISLILLVSIYKFRSRHKYLLMGSIFVFSLFLIKGSSSPFGEVFEYIFSKSLVFQGFRNSFEKFGFLLSLSSSVLLPISINMVANKYKRKRKLIFILSILILVIFFGFPYWTGKVFSFYRKDKKVTIEYKVIPPSFYQSANEWLKENAEQYRFLSLPIANEGITYTWEKGYSGIELSNTLYETPNISYNTTIPFYDNLVEKLTQNQTKKEIFSYQPFISTKYILLRGDINFKERNLPNPDHIKDELNIWEKDGLIEKKFSEDRVSIYEIADKYVWPKIYASNDFIISNSYDFALTAKLLSIPDDNKFAVISSDNTNNFDNLEADYVITGKPVFLSNSSSTKASLSDEDLLARLFYVKHLPDKLVYPFIRLRETLMSPPKGDYEGWMLYKVGTLGKRAVEIYRMNKAGYTKALVHKAELSYKTELKKIEPDLQSFLKSNYSSFSVVVDSLLYQYLLLERSDSESYLYLKDFLNVSEILPYFTLPDISDDRYAVYKINIRKNGEYELHIDDDLYGKDFYVDGKKIEQIADRTMGKVFLNITSGKHELAFLESKLGVLPPDFAQAEIDLNQNGLWQTKIDLPDQRKRYRISFDFLFKKGDNFGIDVMQDIDEENKPTFTKNVRKNPTYHDWQTWTGTFSTISGATNLNILLRPNEVEECISSWLRKSCQLRKQDFQVKLRDFKLAEIKEPGVFLINNNHPDVINNSVSSDVTWEMINPTEYKLKVIKHGNTPEMFVFSELYDPGWELILENGEIISQDTHFLVNGYSNGWIVSKEGEYRMTLLYKNEPILKVTKLIAMIFILSAAVYISVINMKLKNK